MAEQPEEVREVPSKTSHQSTHDPWIALRLWRYALLLAKDLSRQRKRKKLPGIIPMLYYHGRQKYKAARTLWDVFEDPLSAQQTLGEKYIWMDVQGMTDEEIRRSSTTLSMFHFVMKHIQQPGLFSVLTQILRDFRTALEEDRQDSYALFRLILTLVEARFNEDEREQLRALTRGDVSSEEGEDVMRTIAETYMEEGYQKGIEKGRQAGVEEFEASKSTSKPLPPCVGLASTCNSPALHLTPCL